jgi:DNA-binding SARP family transcriptional activator
VLALRLLGELAVSVDGEPRPAPERGPGRALLAWLALHPGAHARGDVAAVLWPDSDPDAALAGLRSALASVRRSLGEAAERHLVATRATVGLDPAGLGLDLDAFRRHVAAGDADRALALWAGEPFQGLQGEWVEEARDEYRTALCDVLDVAARRADAAGDADLAIRLTRRRLAVEPLAEPAVRDLMRRLLGTGDRPGAMLAYGRFAERLERQLGTHPAAGTRAVLAGGDAAQRTAAPTAEAPVPSDDAALGALASSAGPVERAELLLALADRRRRDGAPGLEVRRSYVRAAELARQAGRPDLCARAAMGVCAVPFFPGDAPVDELAVGLLREALGGAPPALAVRLRAHLIRDRALGPGAGDAARDAVELVREARALGDPQALGAALDAWLVACAGQTAPPERRDGAGELVALAASLADPLLELRARVWRVVAAVEGGDLDAAAREERPFEERAAELGEPSWLWPPALWRAMRALAEGELDDGERLAWAAYAVGEQAFGERAALEFQGQLFWLRWRQGRLDELAATAGAAAERLVALPAWRLVRALVEVALGDDGSARSTLGELAAGDFAALPHDVNRLVGLSIAAETALALGDGDLTAAAAAALTPYAGRRPVSGFGGLVLDPVSDTLDRLAAVTSGRPS